MKLDRAARDFGVFRRLYDGVTGHKCAYSNAGSCLRAKSRFRESWRVSERIWTAGLVVIGDEILSGGTQDANIANSAKWLNVQGVRLAEVRIVADLMEQIVGAVNALRSAHASEFTTGGNGGSEAGRVGEEVGRTSRS